MEQIEKKQKEKYEIWLVAAYTLILSIIRITLGILILSLGCSLPRVIRFLFGRDPEEHIIFNFLTATINPVEFYLALIFAILLITLSLIELVFSILLLFRKKSGAIGLLIVSILWIPIEILFVSKFLLVHRTITFIINIIIILFLAKIIVSSTSYFKK